MEDESCDIELECPGCGASVGYDETIGMNDDLGQNMDETQTRCPYCMFPYPTEDWFG